MLQIVNFIPKTVQECAGLLETLRDNPAGVELTDRYGNTAELDASEVKELARAIESQTGLKTPKPVKKASTAKKEAEK